MTRFLARLADLAYRRRGRMVLAVDRSGGPDHRRRLLAGRGIRGRLPHAGLGVEGGERAHPGAVRRLLRPRDQRRLEGRGRRRQPRRPGARQRLLRRGRAGRSRRRARHPDPVLGGRHDRIDHSPADGQRLGRPQGGRREAGRRSRGEQWRRAGDRARRGSDLPGAGVGQPGGGRAPRGHDRAADRLRLGGRRRPAARDRPRRPWHLVRGPDRAARQRRRRPRLDHGGVRADRDRGRHRLLVARPDPVPGGDEGGQGPPRCRGGGRHHRRAQRDHRRRHRRDRRPRTRPDRPALHVRRRPLGLLRRPGRDARRGHAAAGAPLIPRPEGRPPADPLPRPGAEVGGQRRVARRALEPRGPAATLDRRDRRHGRTARAGGPGARHASGLPRRRQRRAGHHDPQVLRPERGGVRARHATGRW